MYFLSVFDFILNNKEFIRASSFLLILLLISIWEVLAPKRSLLNKRSKRWPSNLIVVFINQTLTRIIFKGAAVSASIYADLNSIGLFNLLKLPIYLEIVLSILLLDLIIYFQHYYFHRLPFFWKIHMVHHSDLDFDVTTGARFHPIEILLSMTIKILFCLMLGISPIAIILFEIILNALSSFNHGNININSKLEKILRMFVVTPDMHRIHHSIRTNETNSNFGFNLSIWDKLFKTYISKSADEKSGITIGLPGIRDSKYLNLLNFLKLPFLKKK